MPVLLNQQTPFSPSSIAILHGEAPTINWFWPQIKNLYQAFMEQGDMLVTPLDELMQNAKLEEVITNLARLLNMTEGETYGKLVTYYKAFPLRGGEDINLSNEVLDHYAQFDSTFIPGGWLPLQKIGPGILFVHFLPNAPKPTLPDFFQTHCLVDYKTYERLYAEFMHYDQLAIRKEYNLTTTEAEVAPAKEINKISYSNLVTLLANLAHRNGPDYSKLNSLRDVDVTLDEFEAVFELLMGKVGPEYDIWIQSKASELRDSVTSQLGIPSTPVGAMDPRYLNYTHQERDLSIPAGRKKWIEDNRILPVFVEGNFAVCVGPALSDTTIQHGLSDNLRGMDLFFLVCTDKAYHYVHNERKRETSTEGAMEIIRSTEEIMLATAETVDIDESIDLQDNESTQNFVKRIIANAIEMNASDIHLEMTGTNFRIRYRIDGLLRDMYKPFRSEIAPYIIRVIKGTANMNITETRVPLDGRTRVTYRNRGIDLRIATCPVEAGGGMGANEYEKCVIRILDAISASNRMEDIIWNMDQRETMKRMIGMPYGTIVITGPTGSGKSTTIYTLLNEINAPDTNIMTVEDPVERKIPGVNQTMVSEKTTYPLALRSFLRMDPDVILIGEVRDEETAELTIKASQTGHLVLTTLHANNAIGVISRFRQLKVKAHDIASTVLLVTAQRLIRQLCTRCRIRMSLTSLERAQFDVRKINTVLTQNGFVYSHRGCSYCSSSGYKGRVAVMEMVDVNDEIRTAILKGDDEAALSSLASKYNFKTMHHLGLEAISRGATDFAGISELVASIGFTDYTNKT